MSDELPPLDLSLLAKVGGGTTITDEEPQLPPDTSENFRDITEPPTPPTPGPSKPRTRATPNRGATPPGTPESSPPRYVRDDTPEYRPGILVKPLTELYAAVGTMLLPLSPPVGTAFVQNARPCAESLDELARTNPQVRRVLMSLLQTGAWGKVIAAHMPILLAIGVTYSPSVRQAMTGMGGQLPDSESDTVNPMANGRAR